MNVNDAEVVWAILHNAGYKKTTTIEEADVILLVTCAIRDGAEGKVWARLDTLNKFMKKNSAERPVKIGLLGNVSINFSVTLCVRRKVNFETNKWWTNDDNLHV